MPCPSGEAMRRRDFIRVVGSAAATWPVAAASTAHGQSPKPVIGFLRNTTPDESAYLLTALRKGLNEAGYVEGENLTIDYRWGWSSRSAAESSGRPYSP